MSINIMPFYMREISIFRDFFREIEQSAGRISRISNRRFQQGTGKKGLNSNGKPS